MYDKKIMKYMYVIFLFKKSGFVYGYVYVKQLGY